MLPNYRAMPPITIDQFFLASALMFAALVAFLAAAVARRLHDSGLSGYWGLLPLPFAVYSGTMLVRFQRQFESEEQDMRLFYSIFTSNLLYLVAVALLIVLLARRSAPSPNRFG
jgi:uncharacterized membrane protein YhaH (DUF805 family)